MYSRQAVTYDREKYFTLAQKLEKKNQVHQTGELEKSSAESALEIDRGRS